jgi:hypothetical protein
MTINACTSSSDVCGFNEQIEPGSYLCTSKTNQIVGARNRILMPYGNPRVTPQSSLNTYSKACSRSKYTSLTSWNQPSSVTLLFRERRVHTHPGSRTSSPLANDCLTFFPPPPAASSSPCSSEGSTLPFCVTRGRGGGTGSARETLCIRYSGRGRDVIDGISHSTGGGGWSRGSIAAIVFDSQGMNVSSNLPRKGTAREGERERDTPGGYGYQERLVLGRASRLGR